MKNIFNFFPIILLASGCMLFQEAKTINVVLNPQNNGWYYLISIRDSTIMDTGSIKIELDDNKRLDSVRINHIEKTIVSPYDKEGNSLTDRLKFFLTQDFGNGIIILRFYNPTDEELHNIDFFDPSNKRAYQILTQKNPKEFEKYSKKVKQ